MARTTKRRQGRTLAACAACLAVLLLAQGCARDASTRTPPGDAAGSQAPVAPEPEAVMEAPGAPDRGYRGGGTPIAKARVAFRDDALKPNLNAYSVILLTRGSGRNRLACEAFFNSFLLEDPTTTEAGADVRPVYWLDTRKRAEAAFLPVWTAAQAGEAQACATLTAHYDYERASRLLTGIGKLGVEGPVLLARDKSGDNALVFDLTTFLGKDMPRAMRIWHQKVVQTPWTWNDGWGYIVAREELRNFLQRYGSAILAVIRPSAGLTSEGPPPALRGELERIASPREPAS